jgi:CDP-diacylglycerol--glycerol-3-phosphate 3-phosphatidyltransferase
LSFLLFGWPQYYTSSAAHINQFYPPTVESLAKLAFSGYIIVMKMKLNWANRITITRILLIVPFVSCMLKINDPALTPALQNLIRYIAIFVFMVMAFSDVLDGYLARRKRQTTKLGSFLDPTADKLLMACACLLLSSRRAHVGDFLLPPTVVVLIIGKDLFLLIGFVIIYFITSQIHITPALIGKVATVLQLSMVAAILLAPEFSALLTGWIWFLRVLWWSAAATAILATLIYIRDGSRYIEQYEQGLGQAK